MSAGRRKLPSHLKVVTGTQRVGRTNAAEPKPAVGRPRIPAHLSGHSRVAWRMYAPLLERMGVLSVNDALALERLCQCYAEIRTFEEVIARDGVTYRAPVLDKRGQPVFDKDGVPALGMVRIRPEVAAQADADRRFKAWLTEFGLTPAARSKVNAIPPNKREPGSEYFT